MTHRKNVITKTLGGDHLQLNCCPGAEVQMKIHGLRVVQLPHLHHGTNWRPDIISQTTCCTTLGGSANETEGVVMP